MFTGTGRRRTRVPWKGAGVPEKEQLISLVNAYSPTIYGGMYQLRGEESLIERFYERTDHKREHWANLFNHVGRCLRDSGKHLNQSLIDRIIAFF